ncbi:putative quinone oxidoreductase YhfP [Halobacillus andaensis]|uniref:Quinone oxidoreductase YhfP n=1 Tax=Halobacillus andaensis TaxID=1176239 RepID=A0A917B654_HALAA|nr:acryloyl-CoA reductase [Halobacillus andaensis]MBP2005931.1 putative YhdH/YhfP family quinone oxidoreductase [Halobacillus andaensis]GGF24923.1 putative quinone oxidoreductase YhfP [Halobacillus andaensis]
MSEFQALKVDKTNNGEVSAQIEYLSKSDLPESDVLIKVHYSSVNYKDGMVTTPNNALVKNYPIVPGIDLSGEVVESNDSRFTVGDLVIATSYEIGVNHHGGYSEYASIPGDWVVPLPDGISLEEAMIYGTAGFTAALSVHRLEEAGLTPEHGKVLVTGSTGGVGSMSIAMLSKRGYTIEASTGSTEHTQFLKELGAESVITREDVYDGKLKPLQSERWAAAVDPVGGEQLASILSQLNYNGAVAVSGLTGGTKIPAQVYPFILRGISLIGIDSVYCPMSTRKKIWHRLANDLKTTDAFEQLKSEITLKDVPDTLNDILKGQTRGRTIIKM